MSFISEDFLLFNDPARELYHDVAAGLPIIDYHNHLSPEQIAVNQQLPDITAAWLAGDHYKWRALRAQGINEFYITGGAASPEKFQKWGETVPYTLRNPLYHWTHLELKRYFNIDELLNAQSAAKIYDETTALLQEEAFAPRGLLQMMGVEVICTTDDPADTLEFHTNFAQEETSFSMFPAFRPDAVYQTSDASQFNCYMEKLEAASGKSIQSYADVLAVLEERIAYFHERGCRISDHGLEQLYFFESDGFDPEKLFKKLRNGISLSSEEQAYFTFETLVHLCKLYHRYGWVQQFHLGALRNTNSRMLATLGRDSGFDSIGDFPQAVPLAQFLNRLDSSNQLAKTILYSLNPAWNEVFASMIGNFNDGSIPGKIQFGSGWWYNDQLDGMERQLNALSNMGMLSRFVGMLTDSRSLLSFPRHEYFRRLLCQMIGSDIEKGLLPDDRKFIGGVIRDICYFNARNYFDFPNTPNSKHPLI